MALSKIVQADIDSIISQDLDWNLFQDSTVLVSGANGFLPAYVVETLLHLNKTQGKNIEVLALVRNRDRAQKRFEHHEGNENLKFLVQDVCDQIELAPEQPIDYVIHAASQATPKLYGTDPVGTMLPNIIGTNNLLRIAQIKNSKGFIFFSSGEVYGETGDENIPTKESYCGCVDPGKVRSCYGESKRAGETLCVSWHHQYGVPIKIVRLFHTYGPGMSLDDGRVFADFVSDIIHSRDIVMKSNGEQTRAFCYLADAIAGVFTVLLNGLPGEIYNLGTDNDTSIKDLAEMLVGLFPERNLKVTMQVPENASGLMSNKISRTCPDVSKINALGWKSNTNISDGFKKTIQSYECD